MNINDFNIKVNLPRLVAKQGRNPDEYDFVRIPIFGWYAKSKTSDFIGNVFDFFGAEDWKTLYTTVLDNFEDCLDFKLPRSEYAEKKLWSNYFQYVQYLNAWRLAKEEVHKHRARHGDKVMYFKDILISAGMPNLIDNEVGYLTENVVKAFPKLNLGAKQKYKKVLVIPSFVTPKHICSFEVAKFQTPNEREKLYMNGEMGWYGKMGDEILEDFNQLKIRTGFTWNYKADLWTNKPVRLAEGIGTQELIQIWSDSKRTEFEVDPMDLLISKEGTDNLKLHVANLSHTQITSLEKKTGESLMPYWVESKEQQFTAQGKTFVRRGNSYFVLIPKKNEEEQLTNFALEIKEIRKKTNDKGVEEFYWCGFINHGDSVVPFEMNDKFFTSCYLFAKGIRQQFMTLGMGIPFINERYVRQLLSMIQLTSFNVKIIPE
jgi:hypothetical protein